MAVCRLVHAAGSGVPVPVPAALGNASESVERLDVAHEQAEQRLVQAHVHDLSLPGPGPDVPLEEREHRAVDGELGGGQVGEADRREERFPVREAVHLDPPGDALRDGAEAGLVRAGPGLSVPRQPDENQRRIVFV